MKVWVDCTAAAHPLVLRPIIERLEARGRRGLRHRPRVRADARDPRAAGDPLHGGGQPRRRLVAGQGAGALRPARARLARSVWERQPDLAIAHGSVDLAVVSRPVSDPLGADAGLRVRRHPAPDQLPGRAPGAGPRFDPARAAAANRREGAQAGPLSRPQGGVLPGRLRARPRRSSPSSDSIARRCWWSSARRRRPPSTTPATTSTARLSDRLAEEPGVARRL